MSLGGHRAPPASVVSPMKAEHGETLAGALAAHVAAEPSESLEERHGIPRPMQQPCPLGHVTGLVAKPGRRLKYEL